MTPVVEYSKNYTINQQFQFHAELCSILHYANASRGRLAETATGYADWPMFSRIRLAVRPRVWLTLFQSETANQAITLAHVSVYSAALEDGIGCYNSFHPHDHTRSEPAKPVSNHSAIPTSVFLKCDV